MVINMGRFMVAGFIQLETIVKIDKLPLSYKHFISKPDLIDINIGGDGFNGASALSWLGDEVDFMSMIGGKIDTDTIQNYLDKSDIKLKLDYVLPRVKDMPTSVILYAGGEYQKFEDVKDIRNVEYDKELLEERIQDKDMVLITDANFCRPIIGLAKKYNKPLAVNVRSMRAEKELQKGDFFKAADILYVRDDDIEQDPYECIEHCKQVYDPEIMLFGLGSRGVILYEKAQNSILEYKPVQTNEIVNTMGAGNALFSAFLHYYVKTKDPKEAIKNALLFASYKIGFVGTSNGFMTEEQIEQWKKIIWNKRTF